ncbi:hypothetical protein J2755_000891 [Methanohalophilus levihalophilus]|nr:hypothetical protein [Methanohalophilus levihalophilus]
MIVEKRSLGYGLGKELEKNTFAEIKEGPYAGKGTIHFTDIDELTEIFSHFECFDVEYSMRTINNRKDKICHHVISAKK